MELPDQFITNFYQTVELIQNNDVVLISAPPGTGKSTYLPIMLHQHFLSKKIHLLCPRKLAALNGAKRVSELCQCPIGEKVGYVFKNNKKISEQTSITYWTEGSFNRVLSQKKIDLNSLFILDEFHERSVETDLAMASLSYILSQNKSGKLIIMSATINLDKILEFYQTQYPKLKVTTHIVELVNHPLEIEYLDNLPSVLKLSLEKHVVNFLQNRKFKNALVFCTGKKEIEQVMNALNNSNLNHTHLILPLYSQVSEEIKDQIFNPQIESKIIISTNVAESALTIDGVDLVIDNGLEKNEVFDETSKRVVLTTKRIGQFSSIQRSGRANRQAPGIAIRLYSQDQFKLLKKEITPQIDETNLHQFILSYYQLKSQLITSSLPLFTYPHEKRWNEAKFDLQMLGLIEDDMLTDLAREVLKIPFDYDMGLFLILLKNYQYKLNHEEMTQAHYFLKSKLFQYDDYQYAKQFLNQHSPLTPLLKPELVNSWTDLAILPFKNNLFTLNSQKTKAIFSTGMSIDLNHRELHDFQNDILYLALEIHPESGRILKFTDVNRKLVAIIFKDYLSQSIEVKGQNQITNIYFQKIKIDEYSEKLSSEGLAVLQELKFKDRLLDLSKAFIASEEYIKLNWAIKYFSPNKSLVDFEWNLLLELLSTTPNLTDEEILKEFRQEIKEYVAPNQSYLIDQYFPETFQLHKNKTVKIHFDENKIWIESALQDFYGQKIHPSLMPMNIALTLHILGPHKRCVQITKDLITFFKGSYQDVKKELNADYPKHHWPIDPTNAPPIMLKKNLS